MPEPEPVISEAESEPAPPILEPEEPSVAGGVSAAMAAAAAAQHNTNGEEDGAPEAAIEEALFPQPAEPMPVADLPADPFEVATASAVAVAPEIAETPAAESETSDEGEPAKTKKQKPSKEDRLTVGERFLQRFGQSSLGRWWMSTEWGETMRANAEGKKLQDVIEERRRNEL